MFEISVLGQQTCGIGGIESDARRHLACGKGGRRWTFENNILGTTGQPLEKDKTESLAHTLHQNNPQRTRDINIKK